MNANMLCEMLASCPFKAADQMGNFLSYLCSSPAVLAALGPQQRQQRATMAKLLRSISWSVSAFAIVNSIHTHKPPHTYPTRMQVCQRQ